MRFVDRMEEKVAKAPFVGKHKVVYALFLREHPLDGDADNYFYPEDIIELA